MENITVVQESPLIRRSPLALLQNPRKPRVDDSPFFFSTLSGDSKAVDSGLIPAKSYLDAREIRIMLVGFERIMAATKGGHRQPVTVVLEETVVCYITAVEFDIATGLVIQAGR